MISLQSLRNALLDLLQRLEGTEVKLIIGGGFGIFLKTEHVRAGQVRTLIAPEAWPEARSTNDIDLFLRPELLIASEKLKPLASAIYALGYDVVAGAEKYQFVKPGPGGSKAGSLKIDVLTGPRAAFAGAGLQVDDRRVRPNPSINLHAHPVDEAPTLERNLLPYAVTGRLSSGEAWQGEVHLPHPFTFAMMKLFAFRDRLNDPEKDHGSYHALDLYSIIATTTETEWHEALRLRDECQMHPLVIEAGQIVAEHFAEPERMGMIRLRESPYFRDQFRLTDFASALVELFPRR